MSHSGLVLTAHPEVQTNGRDRIIAYRPSRNFGARRFSNCRRPGPNSWSRSIPMSLPIPEPRVLSVIELDRAQYGRYAVARTFAINNPRKYDVFSVFSPESLRVIKTREAA